MQRHDNIIIIILSSLSGTVSASEHQCTRSHEEMIGCLTVLTRRGDEMFLWKIAFMVAESSGNFYFILQNVKKIYGAIGNRNFIHSTCITWLDGRPKMQTGAAARAKAPTRSLITLASVATCCNSFS